MHSDVHNLEENGYAFGLKTREDNTSVKHVKRLEEHVRYILDSNVLLPEPKIVSLLFVGHRSQGIVCNNRSEIWVRCGYDALFFYIIVMTQYVSSSNNG